MLAISGAITQLWWLAALAAGLAGAVALSGRWEKPTRPAAPQAHEKPPAEVVVPAPPGQPEPRVRAVSLTAEPADVVRALYRSALPLVRAVSAHLWLQDAATATFRLIAAEGEMCPESDPIPVGDPSVSAVVSRGSASVVPILGMRNGAGTTTLWRFAFPVVGGDMVGVAFIDIKSPVEPHIAESLESIACDLQPNLATALQLTVARSETVVAGHLLEAAHELSRRLRPDEVATITLERGIALSDAISGSVLLMDESSGLMHIVASHGLPDDVVERTAVQSGEGIAGWVYASSKPLLVEDLPSRGHSRRHGVRSAVSVPIADDDGCLGVLSVGSRDYPARFTDAHMRALGLLARESAVALRNARAMESSGDLFFATLTALMIALETKDPFARGGTGRVTDIVLALADAYGLAATDRHALHVAALLHDMGMGLTGGPIGNGNRPLSTVERGMLKAHPVVAAEILADVPALKEVVPIVYHHHEWYDGHGYVGGLAGEAIPLGSRILAVADAFVAMTSDRPYRHAMTVRAAVDELSAKSGSQFDPDVVSTLRDILRRDPDLALTTSGE